MRAILLSTVVLVFSLPIWAGEREAKAALALALAQGQTVKSKQQLASCGKCRTDEPEARIDALAEGKPLVLFVGGPCEGMGGVVIDAGGVAVKVPSYEHDDKPASAKRIVILEPKHDGSGFLIDKTLDDRANPEDLKKAIAEAKPVAKSTTKKKLDWFN